MMLTVSYPAPHGSCFGPKSFANMVGRRVPMKVNDAAAGTGLVIAARVVDGGQFVHLTLEADVDLGPLDLGHHARPDSPPPTTVADALGKIGRRA